METVDGLADPNVMFKVVYVVQVVIAELTEDDVVI